MADIPLLRRGQRPPDNMQRQVPMPRMDPRMFMREFMPMPDQRMIEGMPDFPSQQRGFEGIPDYPRGYESAPYTPPGMREMMPIPDNTPRGVDPADRQQLDAIIQQMLNPSYKEGDNIPRKNQLPPGAIENMLREVQEPPVNDQSMSFEQYYGEKDT